ncbi:MAG: hypothetical protein PVF47_01020 [Anaerolineae bacterium]
MTGNEFFRTITEENEDYVVREMLDLAGGFYSTQDADPTALRSGDDRSEGEESKFFIWTPDNFMAAYGATRHGNASAGSTHGFEGRNITALLKLAGFTNDWRTIDIAHQALAQMLPPLVGA